MGFFHNDIAVDLATDLQAITASSNPARVQNGLYYVRETDLWYRYELGGTPSGSDITPNDSLGAFKVGASGGGGGGSLTVGSTTPIGNVTPSAVGQIYIWEQSPSPSEGEKKVYFRSTGTGSGDWEAFGGTSVMWLDNFIVGDADFLGQQAFELSSGSGSASVNAHYVAISVGSGNDFSQVF